MERLQTKRNLAPVDLQKLSDQLTLLKTTDDLEPEHEDRIAEITAELEVIAKDQDALIDPHVSDDDFAEECVGVRKYEALITRMRTRLERLQRKSLSGGVRPVKVTQQLSETVCSEAGASEALCSVALKPTASTSMVGEHNFIAHCDEAQFTRDEQPDRDRPATA
ncbi:hypothetical protein HPB52_007147 [Rhipicephalus sanguineus]|uniref:Uncharacterized protein n=1 Tax=Rhipicephalus sanguineus TaxID=34632 RepID=A0A9D4PFX8_RHISA|nr:hypothetical protein HPB52_007147 [Rhipicephalus sanguineus]